MDKEYRTIQPSKYEGKISREAAASVFRAIADGKIKVGRERRRSIAGETFREGKKK